MDRNLERDENDPSPLPGPSPPSKPTAAYQFSPEELRILKECNRESFYQRCIPLSAMLGIGTFYGVKSGYFKGHPRFGATPKVVVAGVIGYFIGKFSYRNQCAEKLMRLPHSKIGEMLRQRKQGNVQEGLDPNFGPSMSLSPFSGMSSYDTYSDTGPNNSLDIDTSRPSVEGLDDSHRPSVDNPVYEEEMPPIQKNTTSYEELRRKNREEFQQRRVGNYRGLAETTDSSTSTIRTPSSSAPESTTSTGRTTKYGDAWG